MNESINFRPKYRLRFFGFAYCINSSNFANAHVNLTSNFFSCSDNTICFTFIFLIFKNCPTWLFL